MPKYIATLKFCCYLFPKKNCNKKNTSFFYPGEGVKTKFFWVKKKLLLFHPDLLVLCTLKVVHIFAQTFSHNVDLQ